MFHSYFDRKYDTILTFNIVDFPNFEMSIFLLLAPPSNKRRTSQFQNLVSARGSYLRKYGMATVSFYYWLEKECFHRLESKNKP